MLFMVRGKACMFLGDLCNIPSSRYLLSYDFQSKVVQSEPEPLPESEPVIEDVGTESYDGVVLRVPARGRDTAKTTATGHTASKTCQAPLTWRVCQEWEFLQPA